MNEYPIPPAPGAFAWDGQDLPALLALDKTAADQYRNRRHDPNMNGRAYGGQVLAQTLAAAMDTVPLDRMPTVLQAVFLQGTRIDVPLDLKVENLQEGKRYSSRHVRGTQGETSSIDAHCSFQVPLNGPEHQFPYAAPAPAADTLKSNREVFAEWKDRFDACFGGGRRDEEKSRAKERVFPSATNTIVGIRAASVLNCGSSTTDVSTRARACACFRFPTGPNWISGNTYGLRKSAS